MDYPFRGAIWAFQFVQAFPCSVALLFRCANAFPCCVPLVLWSPNLLYVMFRTCFDALRNVFGHIVVQPPFSASHSGWYIICPKVLKSNGLGHLGGMLFGGPTWTIRTARAFPCSVAFAFHYLEPSRAARRSFCSFWCSG